MNRRIGILRLDHRSMRDQRITTHVALTGRAFGAASFTYTGEKDDNMEDSISDVSRRWGGEYQISYIESPKQFIKNWEGIVVHLTMYGEMHMKTIVELEKFPKEPILLIVGGAKVPRYIYSLVDFNTAIGWQPHSEVAATGIFLEKIQGDSILYQSRLNASIKINQENAKSIRSERFRKQ